MVYSWELVNRVLGGLQFRHTSMFISWDTPQIALLAKDESSKHFNHSQKEIQ